MIRQRFEDLVSREYARLLAIAKRWGCDGAGVSDVTIVDAVLERYRSRKIYKRLRANEQNVLGYLAVSVTNQTMTAHRRTKGTYENLGMLSEDGDGEDYVEFAHRINTEDAKKNKETGRWQRKGNPVREPVELSLAVENALTKLSPIERLVAVRILIERDTYRDLAKETGKSMSSLQRAGVSCQKKLKAILSPFSA